MHADDREICLVGAAQAGDRSALAILVERYRPMLRALCAKMLGDPVLVDDASQEAILQAMLSLNQLRRPERFGAWLGGIGLNVCRAWLRQRAREHQLRDEPAGGRVVHEPIDWRSDPAELIAEAELVRRVRDAVADLPSGQRAAVLLFYLAGLTYPEVAAQLDIEVGAVKTRLFKARAALRHKLREFWFEERSMAETPNDEPREVRVVTIRRGQIGEEKIQRCAVVLEEIVGGRQLCLWIGDAEAGAIALRLKRVEFSRPGPYQLMVAVLQATGGRLRETIVDRLVNDVFYASLVVEGHDGVRTIDARPSDAINVALLVGAPIRVAPAIFETAGTAVLKPESPGGDDAATIVAEITERWQSWQKPHWGMYQPVPPDPATKDSGEG